MAETVCPPEKDNNHRVLELIGVSKRFGGVVALNGVDFDLRRGEVHGLVGENGAGKSTLVKIIAGVHSDFEGEMRFNGKPVRFRSPAAARDGGIGMVHQELSIVRYLTVAENVFLGTRLVTQMGVVRWRAMCEQATAQLAELGIHVDVKRPAGLLNVGVQQLIEIARTIFSGAEIIILDEPTSALSPPEAERLFEFIAMLKNQGKTIVFISHFIEDVLRVSDRVTVLKNGNLVCTVDSADVDKNFIVESMLDADARLLRSAYTGEASHELHKKGNCVLRVEGLTKSRRFSDINLELYQGEILGLYGFMGAGLTEVATCLFGFEQSDQGTITLDGKPVRIRKTAEAKQLGLAYVSDNRRLSVFPGKEVFKNVTVAYLDRMLGWVLKRRVELAATDSQIQRVGVNPPNPFLNVTSLSGGNQQKVVLAKWLTYPPKVLILNEPTRGIDVGAKDEILRLIRSLREEGVSIILISSEPEIVLGNSDRILVMSKGRITKEFVNDGVTKDNLMKYA